MLLSVFTLRPSVFFERSPGSLFAELGRLQPFFAALRSSQAFPKALAARPSLSRIPHGEKNDSGS